MKVDVMQIVKSNAGLLKSIDDDVFDEKITSGRLTAYLEDQSHIMVAAAHDNVVIGQVLAVVHRHPDKPTELYIDDLAVSEKFQRNGIATLLLKKIISIGVDRGCEEIWVATEPDNKAANSFYESLRLTQSRALVFEGEL